MKRVSLYLALAIATSSGCECRRSPTETGAPEPGALPGAEPFPAELAGRIDRAVAELGDGYVPRTRHRTADGSALYTNRLILETSPYLRQHAHNPVNWYPWGDEAFETARRLGRPVLLSVGYSTCHWCHVMEEESFEDVEIATYLNAHYVAIKVDREERPDIDSVYMAAVRAMRKGGGWPMTVWLTPDREPYYGGGYFPPRAGDRGESVGFLELLGQLGEQYTRDPSGVAVRAGAVADQVEAAMAPLPRDDFDGAAVLRAAADYYEQRFDSVAGGLVSRSAKFPASLPVRFLLRYHRRTGAEQHRHMALFSLEKMAAGGLYDHVGGGFHRYSTDPAWLVPHFEKMLYDNALLASAYLEAYQLSGDEPLGDVARDVLRYAARELRAPTGAFYAASDADNLGPSGQREEGEFFVWTPADVRAAVAEPALADLVIAHFGVTEAGNFRDLPGHSVLAVAAPLAETAARFGMSEADARDALAAARDQLYRFRAARTPPLRDEKILAAWNGMMISALAHAHRVLGPDPVDDGASYAEQAARAARFVLTEMRRDGRLVRAYSRGEASIDAFCGDYAFVIQGLLDLFEATADTTWVDEAVALDRVLAAHYEDASGGGLYATADDAEVLLAREKPLEDNAVPSCNAVHALNLLRLYELTTDEAYRARAQRTFEAFSGVLTRAPSAMSQMLLAIDFATDVAKQIVVVAPESRDQAAPFLDVLARTYVPNAVVVVAAEPAIAELARRVPVVANKIAQRGQTTAYVCKQRVCELPTRDPGVFAEQLAENAPLP